MPILYVNSSKKRGVRVRGRAKVRLHRRGRRNPTRKVGEGGRTRKTSMARKIRRRRKSTKRSVMARRKKKSHRRARRGKKSHRRRARKAAPKKRRRSRRRARKAAAPKRRRRARRTKRRRTRRRARRGKRRSKHRARRRTRRSKRRRARRRTRRSRRRRARRSAHVMYGPTTVSQRKTLVGYAHNPRRRRRSRRRYAGRARRSRRIHRRYRSYRKNPGGMLIDLAKRAAPVLIGFYGARLIAAKVGPMIPGVSNLGTFQAPALALGTVVGVNFLTKKVGKLAKYRESLMLGAGLALLDSLITSFAPASVKGYLGVGDVYDRALSDYVAVGDYVAMGATPLDDHMTMSDYIAVGGDGVEQELGIEEELGVEEELGNDLLGGVSRNSMLRQVQTKAYLSPVPARSFTQQIPAAGGQYDSADQVSAGIFRGGF